MKKIILDFPNQFKIGLKAAEKIKTTGIFEKIVVCGMGGSALPADLAKMLASDLGIKIPIIIHRSYGLPFLADKKSLVICISYSGNTEESVSSFIEAFGRKLSLVAIGSGGKLWEMAQKNNIPMAKIPEGFQPRMALGFQFSALVKILINCNILAKRTSSSSSPSLSLPESSVDNVEAKLLVLKEELNPQSLEKQAKNLAAKLKGQIPLIYSSTNYKTLAKIWKIKFNENSKIPAFSNYFPELNHNEMVGFTKIPSVENLFKKLHVLIIKEETDDPRILKRMDLTAKLLKNKEIETDFILLREKGKLLKIFSNILLSDWVSYYLALENKIDPIAVQIVEDFKRKMEKN